MKLSTKVLANVFLDLLINVILICILSSAGLINIVSVTCIFIEAFIWLTYVLVKFLLKPLDDLHSSLKAIDFESSIIDFTGVDALALTGFSQVQDLIKRYKYLLDIIAERITKFNNETYKSEHDTLTGLYNRTRLTKMRSRYEVQRSLFVIFFDVNNLKRMNDNFGHDAGDILLKSAAGKLKFWESYGDVYRLGGDEFLVVLVNKRNDYCMDLLNTWYPSVGSLNRTSDGFECHLAYGIARGTVGSSFDALQSEADDNMYIMKQEIKAKFGGR